ncbi:hypothetical protein TH25_04350 [Thalassospira profundimaris]|uniref:Uncharacterized protein n=1 Tax=Thalassospira profundimaris TaxID=502049 RepID=A0A367XJB7_9PROT|nr:hypothetical protein [Thalassospira profundimaris]RCK53744.1 hypothetical protein TH25_04350 [Thalassospira profundimaris]
MKQTNPRAWAIALGMAAFLSSGGALAKQPLPASPQDLIDNSVISEVRTWLANPVVEISVKGQNARNVTMSQAEIDAADKQWRAERESEDQPLIAAVLNNPLSGYLTQIQARSGGLYSEVFVTDMHGLNVGQSSITSDFWQGDEAKFQKTYPNGAGAVFIDEAEYIEAVDNWRAQLNMTVSDSAGKPMGAVTVEINLTELARRKGL